MPLLAEIMSLLVVVVVMMMVLVLVGVIVLVLVGVMTIMKFITCSHFLRYHAYMQWNHVMSANVWWL